MLWFGWFGFNAGSALGSGALAVSTFNATHMAAAGAGLSWALADKLLKGKVNLTGVCIGIVVGLVAVTPASGFVSTGSGLLIGLVGGLAANIVAYFRAKSQLDDSLDVFACHGVGGLVGTLMCGLLSSKEINSAGVDGGMAQMFIQLKASLVAAAFAFIATFIIMKVIDMTVGLRPNADNENRGLDHSEHGEKAYT